MQTISGIRSVTEALASLVLLPGTRRSHRFVSSHRCLRTAPNLPADDRWMAGYWPDFEVR